MTITIYTLTVDRDTFVNAGDALFDAPLAGVSGTQHTLTDGDSLLNSGGSATLDATFLTGATTDTTVTGLDIQGVATWIVRNLGSAGTVLLLGENEAGRLVDLASLAYDGNGQAASLAVGDDAKPVIAPAAHLDELAVSVSRALGDGRNGLALNFAPEGFGGSAAIDVAASLVGGLQGAAVAPPPMKDGNPNWTGFADLGFAIAAGPAKGTGTSPGFITWHVASSGASGLAPVRFANHTTPSGLNIVALGAEGSAAAKSLSLRDDGSSTMLLAARFGDGGASDWANLASVDLTASDGFVILTGAQAGADGLLSESTTKLQSIVIKGSAGSGNGFYDLSGLIYDAASPAPPQAVIEGGAGGGVNEVAVNNTVVVGKGTIRLSDIEVLDDTGNLGVHIDTQGDPSGGGLLMDMSKFQGLVPLRGSYTLMSDETSSTNVVGAPFTVLQLLNSKGGIATTLVSDLQIRNGPASFAVNMQGMANGGSYRDVNAGHNITIQNGFPINPTDSLKLWLSYDGLTDLPDGLTSGLDVPTFSVTNYASVDVYLRYDGAGAGAQRAVFLGSSFVNDFPVTTTPSSLAFFDNTDTYAPAARATDLYLGRIDGGQSVPFAVAYPSEAIGHDSVLIRGEPGTSTISHSGRGMFFIGATDASALHAASTHGLVMDVAGTATGTAEHIAGIAVTGSDTWQNLLQGSSGQIELDLHGRAAAAKVYTPLVQVGPASNGLSGIGQDHLTGGLGRDQAGAAASSGDNFFGAGGPDTIVLGDHGKSGYAAGTVWIGVYNVGHGGRLGVADIGATYGQAITDIRLDAKANQYVESYVNGYGPASSTNPGYVTTVERFALGAAGDRLAFYAPDWASGPLGVPSPLQGPVARGLVDGSGDAILPGDATVVATIHAAGQMVAGDANVIVDLIERYDTASELATGLATKAGAMTFDQSALTRGSTEHLIVAYTTKAGDVRIADVTIANVSAGSLTSFSTADHAVAISAADLVSLADAGDVGLASLSTENILFAVLSSPPPLGPYAELAHSTYLDLDSYRSGAEPLSGGTPVASFTLNVALILARANDPTPLLSADWASRQKQLAELEASGKLWSTYGADRKVYDGVLADLATLGIQTVDEVSSVNGYVSSPESRTIWVQVDQGNFTTLFGPTARLLEGTDPSGKPIRYWEGSLSLPTDWVTSQGVVGLSFDTNAFRSVLPDPGNGVAAPMAQQWQSPGNAADKAQSDLYPHVIVDTYYDFPFAGPLWDPSSGSAVATGSIGLVEPGVGTSLPGDDKGSGFQAAIDSYRQGAGISTSAVVIDVAPGLQSYPTVAPPAFNPAGERSLDVGVVTATNPQSPLILYAGSGTKADAQSNAYTAYQSSFWDTANDPAVVTSSFRFATQSAPGSPFLIASRELFVDAALRNISVLNSNGDGGSGDQYGNGLTNVGINRASPYAVMVGGTSISTTGAAMADPTLATITAAALAGDPAILWQLIAGGLATLPTAGNLDSTLIETVWNRYYLDGTKLGVPGAKEQTGFLHNNTGSGGVDPTQPVPAYQSDFGLTPTTSDPQALVGRGTPDVSANAGGNMLYIVPTADMTGTSNDDGTSAATPLWASLVSQINAVFHDQELPQLGYFTDLLYQAAAIAPAAFNDIQVGSNTSSFTLGGPIASDGTKITPTGYGYSAGPGYDLVTGLGTPNGELLARALTAIAHEQRSWDSIPHVVASDRSSWQAAAAETLLVQATSAAAATVSLLVGRSSDSFTSVAASPYAWTSLLAQQTLQDDFDAALVRLFDGATQGALGQAAAASGDGLTVLIDGVATHAPRANLTNPFGFIDFVSTGDASAVRVARPVAVAETVGGHDNQTAVVRIRQSGIDSLALELYRVDDLDGSIDGLQPGAAGYAAAAQARAYATITGGTAIAGPGYGNYAEVTIADVDAGDLVAMKLTNVTQGSVYWAFAQANESVGGQPVGHLWNYGLNTWGWEDTSGGGDRDYNDLVVGLDFTSTFGHAWLA